MNAIFHVNFYGELVLIKNCKRLYFFHWEILSVGLVEHETETNFKIQIFPILIFDSFVSLMGSLG